MKLDEMSEPCSTDELNEKHILNFGRRTQKRPLSRPRHGSGSNIK
jgi:hypothetical protein